MGASVTIIWGSVLDSENYVAASRGRSVHDLVFDGEEYARIEVGPATIDGPLLTPTTPSENDDLYVLADEFIPDWVSPELLRQWGWTVEQSLPRFTTNARFVDVLLLTTNWTGNFEGWSSQVWLPHTPVVLQRLDLPIARQPSIRLPVRVLETGFDRLGMPTLVSYTPEPEKISGIGPGLFGLSHLGWRKESWVKLRRSQWADLAMASEVWETRVQYLLGQPMVERIEVHNPGVPLPDHVRRVLPEDVQIAFRELDEGY